MNLKKKQDKTITPVSASKHPKVSEMVLLAIAMLNERNGSSLQAIKKYISQSFKTEIKNLSLCVKKYLRIAVASGILVQTKGKGAAGRFRLGGSLKLKMSELLARFPNQSKSETNLLESRNGQSVSQPKSVKKISKIKSSESKNGQNDTEQKSVKRGSKIKSSESKSEQTVPEPKSVKRVSKVRSPQSKNGNVTEQKSAKRVSKIKSSESKNRQIVNEQKNVKKISQVKSSPEPKSRLIASLPNNAKKASKVNSSVPKKRLNAARKIPEKTTVQKKRGRAV